MKHIALFITMFLLIWMLPEEKQVHACSCMRPPPVSESVEQSDGVFIGKVTAIVDEQSNRRVTIDVSEAWKGVDTQVVEILTGFNSADCGLPVEVGESYLFYANYFGQAEDENSDEKKWLTSTICSRTATETNAASDLKELGEGNKNLLKSEIKSSEDKSTNNWIWGSISLGVLVLVVFVIMFNKYRKRRK